MPASPEKAIRAALLRGEVAPVYLLVGDDERAKTPLIEALGGLVEPDLRAFNLERLYANEHPLADIVASARTLPLLGTRRVVIALHCEAFLKPRRKVPTVAEGDGQVGGSEEDAEDEGTPTDAVADLLRYVGSPSPETVLVLVAADVPRNTRIGKQLLKTATIVEFWGLKTDREAKGQGVERALQAAERLVRERIQQAGFRIRPEAIGPLVEHAGTDISVLRSDLERLILFCSGRQDVEITERDVAAVVSGAALINPWAVTNAIEGRDPAQALRQLAVQLDEGVSPHMILGQLRWFVSEKMAQFAPTRVGSAVDALFRTDGALKSSGGDPQILLERLVVELCGAGGGRATPARG